jgi:hypothetical protein
VSSRRVASSERVGEGEGAGNRGKSSVDCAVPQRCVVLLEEGRYFAIATRRLAPFFENQVTQLRAKPSTQRLHHSHHSQRRQHSRRVQNSCFCTLMLVLAGAWMQRATCVCKAYQAGQSRAEQRPGQVGSGQVRSSAPEPLTRLRARRTGLASGPLSPLHCDERDASTSRS